MPTAFKKLSSTEVGHYRTEGYLLWHHQVFGGSKLARLRTLFEEKIANLREGERPEQMDVPHFVDTRLFEWLFAVEVLDLVEDVIGPDIDLYSSHLIAKPAGGSMRVPWHEDSAYWRDWIEPMEVVTVWLALDRSDEENGCMYVVPRSQDKGFSEYYKVDPDKNLFMTEIRKGQFDESKAVPLVLAEGEASLHQARLIHGSPANTSKRRRMGYTMRYIASTTRLNPDNPAKQQVYHARGKDHGVNRYADPSRNYPELLVGRMTKGH